MEFTAHDWAIIADRMFDRWESSFGNGSSLQVAIRHGRIDDALEQASGIMNAVRRSAVGRSGSGSVVPMGGRGRDHVDAARFIEDVLELIARHRAIVDTTSAYRKLPAAPPEELQFAIRPVGRQVGSGRVSARRSQETYDGGDEYMTHRKDNQPRP